MTNGIIYIHGHFLGVIQSGLVEVALAQFIADKTNWRNMLKGQNDTLDLKAAAAELIPQISEKLTALKRPITAAHEE